jgi:broad specificity phosphatase PhoE
MVVNSFFVVRHGETQANVMGVNAGPLDYPLTKKGKKEIEYLAKALSETKISGVYSSPVFRAVETAKIMARPHKLVVQTLEGLTESKLKAEFVGKKGRKRILITPEAFDETRQELQKRMVRSIEEIKKKASGNVIVVSHGDPITALLEYVVERKIESNGYYVLHPDPGSVSVIDVKDRLELVLFNYHRKLFQPWELGAHA